MQLFRFVIWSRSYDFVPNGCEYENFILVQSNNFIIWAFQVVDKLEWYLSDNKTSDKTAKLMTLNEDRFVIMVPIRQEAEKELKWHWTWMNPLVKIDSSLIKLWSNILKGIFQGHIKVCHVPDVLVHFVLTVIFLSSFQNQKLQSFLWKLRKLP